MVAQTFARVASRPTVWRVVDPIFAEPRLAEVYDPLDPDRSDLVADAAMVDEFGARGVLDFGCGTGTITCLLARRGLSVTEVTASLGAAGYVVDEVRQAPERPGRELVFIARRPTWLDRDVRLPQAVACTPAPMYVRQAIHNRGRVASWASLACGNSAGPELAAG